MKKLILQISETESIEIVLGDNFRRVDFCCSEIKAYFIDSQKICIGEDTAGSLFIAFLGSLKKVINNQLTLHESINQNLGLMENEYCHDLLHVKPNFFIDSATRSWIGSKYNVWSTYNTTKPMLTTWLYNDHDGRIIFEITPLYKWSFFPDNLQDPVFVTYEEFMKDYKPLIHRVVSRELAIEWLEQTMKVYRGFFSTEDDYIRSYKENNW